MDGSAGKYVAKTEGGKLVFLKEEERGKKNQRQRKPALEANQEKGISKTIRDPKQQRQRSDLKTRRDKDT